MLLAGSSTHRPIARRFVCDRCFEKVDVDKSGFLEVIEIEVAMLYLYNMVSERGGGNAATLMGLVLYRVRDHALDRILYLEMGCR